jgi:L-cysteine desulfidase
MNVNTHKKFEKLLNEFHRVEAEEFDYRELEKYLIKILFFIKSHPDEQEYFIKYFVYIIDAINSNGLADKRYIHINQLLQYCMRDLQWPEIKTALLNRLSISTFWREEGCIADILDVYEDEWADDDLYEYFSKQ